MKADHDIVAALLAHGSAEETSLSEDAHAVHADADLLAAYIAGTLGDDEQDMLERRLAEEDHLRTVWLEVRRAQSERAVVAYRPHGEHRTGPTRPDALSPQSTASPAWRLPLAIAACILVGLAMWKFAQENSTSGPEMTQSGSMIAKLEARAAELRAGEAPWLGVLPLLGESPPTPGLGPRFRDGVTLHGPIGRQLSVRPTFRFTLPTGTAEIRLRVEEEASGKIVFERRLEGSPLSWPAEQSPLKPGTKYFWHLSGKAPLGTLEASASIEVVEQDERNRVRSLLTSLQASEKDVDHLLAVVVALDNGFVDEAARRFSDVPASMKDTVVSDRVRVALNMLRR